MNAFIILRQKLQLQENDVNMVIGEKNKKVENNEELGFDQAKSEFVYLNNINKEKSNSIEIKQKLDLHQYNKHMINNNEKKLEINVISQQPGKILPKPVKGVRICDVVQNIETKERFSLAQSPNKKEDEESDNDEKIPYELTRPVRIPDSALDSKVEEKISISEPKVFNKIYDILNIK